MKKKPKENSELVWWMSFAMIIISAVVAYMIFSIWFDSTFICTESEIRCYYESCPGFNVGCRVGWQCHEECLKYELKDKNCPMGYECFNTSEEAKKATENRTEPYIPYIGPYNWTKEHENQTRCYSAGDCFHNNSLEGCWKIDPCNWCCGDKYGYMCTLVYCDWGNLTWEWRNATNDLCKHVDCRE